MSEILAGVEISRRVNVAGLGGRVTIRLTNLVGEGLVDDSFLGTKKLQGNPHGSSAHLRRGLWKYLNGVFSSQNAPQNQQFEQTCWDGTFHYGKRDSDRPKWKSEKIWVWFRAEIYGKKICPASPAIHYLLALLLRGKNEQANTGQVLNIHPSIHLL